jgi:hypothetical protein
MYGNGQEVSDAEAAGEYSVVKQNAAALNK